MHFLLIRSYPRCKTMVLQVTTTADSLTVIEVPEEVLGNVEEGSEVLGEVMVVVDAALMMKVDTPDVEAVASDRMTIIQEALDLVVVGMIG